MKRINVVNPNPENGLTRIIKRRPGAVVIWPASQGTYRIKEHGLIGYKAEQAAKANQAKPKQ